MFMKKIIKLTESDLTKLVNEVIMTLQQMNDLETPFEPFIYKVYSENDTESFENTFKQPFPKDETLYFPMVVIGFDTSFVTPLNTNRDRNKSTYEIEHVKVYIPFMYQRMNGSDRDLKFWRAERTSWVSCGNVRVTKNNIPKEYLDNMVRKMNGRQTIGNLASLLGHNRYNTDNKNKLNSSSIIEKKLSDLLNPYTPELPDLPPKKEYGDFEYAD